MKRTKETISAPIFTHLTLGKKSSFDYAVENGVLLLRFGKMNYFLVVKNEIITSVKNVFIKSKKQIKNDTPFELRCTTNLNSKNVLITNFRYM